jgi:AcrR family transcriptional regulator
MRKKSHEKKRFINTGRINQKMKTRERLLNAAHDMAVMGKEINIEVVAKQANMSKATAYRYFSSKEVLQREAALHFKSQEKKDLFANLAANDLEGRLERLLQYHFQLLTDNEREFRLFLSAVMQDSVQAKEHYSRAGRRILLIEEALLPLRPKVPKEEFSKMVSAISVILGIESITILKDLCQVEKEEILEIWKWMIGKLLKK